MKRAREPIATWSSKQDRESPKLRHLYARAGFLPCGPFADYIDNGFSHFMKLELHPTRS